MSNLSEVIEAVIIASIIVPVGFREAVNQKWVTKKEASLTLAITIPIYVTILIAVIYQS